MAENKKSFILYCDQKGVWDKLDDGQAGKLIKHIIAYVNDENPTAPDFITELAFEPIKQQLKRDLVNWRKQYDQRVEAGKRSAEARKRNATTVNERSISSTVNVNVNGNVILKEDERKLSEYISLVYSKKYDRKNGIGQDVETIAYQILKKMPLKDAQDQIRNHKLFVSLKKLTLPSRLETILEAIEDTDWVEKMKELNKSDETTNQQTNELIRSTAGRSRISEIPAAFDGRIDSE